MKDKKDNKLMSMLEKIGSYYPGICFAILALQMLAIFQPINVIYSTLLVTINILLFLLTKDLSESKDKNFKFIKVSFVLFIYNILGVFLAKMEQIIPTNKSLKPMLVLLGIGIGIGLISLFTNDENREKIEKVKDADILSRLGIDTEKFEEGDIILCKNKETGKDVLIPFKDRFLHMLVLGPTGSGKTSQVMIPMIHQDIKSGQGVTVIEPKGDLAEKIFAMGEHYERETIYFNPTMPDCPYFNPLYGPEDEVIENMATTFKMLNPDSPQFFQDMNETLIRNSLRVLKRLKKNTATLVDLSTLIYNSQGQGKVMINRFSQLSTDTVEELKENAELASWFLNDYYNERSKTYEHCSGLRSQVSKITSNIHLRRVLNPPDGQNDVNFEKIIEEGKILAISTAQGDLRDLGKFLGYFIILNFQSAVFKRPGTEDTRIPHFLYIDEFQTYSTPGFADMLTQGRSYRVASHLATQNRALMAMGGGRDGDNFVKLVSTNARNLVLFPGGSAEDAKYYSEEFGEIEKVEVMKGETRTKFNPLYGIQKMGYPSENVRESKTIEPRFSPSDIIYKDFGEIIYKTVKSNTLQKPDVGTIEFIPWDLNVKLDEMVNEYNKKQKKKFEEIIKEAESENNDEEDLEEEKEEQLDKKINSAKSSSDNKKENEEKIIKKTSGDVHDGLI